MEITFQLHFSLLFSRFKFSHKPLHTLLKIHGLIFHPLVLYAFEVPTGELEIFLPGALGFEFLEELSHEGCFHQHSGWPINRKLKLMPNSRFLCRQTSRHEEESPYCQGRWPDFYGLLEVLEQIPAPNRKLVRKHSSYAVMKEGPVSIDPLIVTSKDIIH